MSCNRFDLQRLRLRRRRAPFDDEPTEDRRTLRRAFPRLANHLEADNARLGCFESDGVPLRGATGVGVNGGEEVDRAGGEGDLD